VSVSKRTANCLIPVFNVAFVCALISRVKLCASCPIASTNSMPTALTIGFYIAIRLVRSMAKLCGTRWLLNKRKKIRSKRVSLLFAFFFSILRTPSLSIWKHLRLSKDETSNKKQESENKKVSKSSIGPSLDFIVNNKTYNNLVANGRSVHDVQSNVESMNRNESAPIGIKYNFQNLKRTFSSDLSAKKTSNVSNFQVEGRRLNNGTALDPMDDLTDFTNSLLMQYNLHNEPLSHASKPSSHNTRFNIKKPDLRRNKELSVMNNKRNTSNNIDVFDISALIQDKPYQLSKIHANQKHQTTQLNQMPNLDNINLADLVYNMDLEQEEPETQLNKSCTTNMSSNNTQQTLISTNNLIFQLGPSHDSNYQANHQPHHLHQQQQIDNAKASLINKKKAHKQRTLFKAKQSSKNEPTPQVLDADLTDLIHVNNLTNSKLKSSDQI